MEKIPLMVKIEQETSQEDKTFWPDKEKFFAEKDAFIQKKLEGVKNKLKQIGFEDEYLGKIATIVLRGYYVTQYLLDHSPVEKSVPVKVVMSNDLPDSKIGVNRASFLFSGERIPTSERFKEIADSEELKKVDLEDISINFNVGRLEQKLRGLKEEKEGISQKNGDVIRQIEELAIQFEAMAIEESAHSFYWMSVVKNIDKFRKAVKEILYNYTGKRSSSHLEYEDVSPETRAALWKRSYLRKYYPESEVLHVEERRRLEQKERMEKVNKNPHLQQLP